SSATRVPGTLTRPGVNQWIPSSARPLARLVLALAGFLFGRADLFLLLDLVRIDHERRDAFGLLELVRVLLGRELGLEGPDPHAMPQAASGHVGRLPKCAVSALSEIVDER